VNDYNAATDLGNALSYLQTGLTCGTSVTAYVWPYNICGHSGPLVLNAATEACVTPCENFTVTHTSGAVAPETVTVTYNTVSTALSGNTKCWITQNLGATAQPGSALENVTASRGWFWQFNRSRGYRASPVSPAWTITSFSENSDWQPSNDPCQLLLGSGWRLPTSSEWVAASSGWASAYDSFGSVLKVHTAGFLESANGNFNCGAWCGLYWSSTQMDATTGIAFYNGNSWIQNPGRNKAYGYSARCLK
jgi:hypothetical protein